MPMQYIKDTNGTTTAVVIPIEEWKQMTAKYQDSKQLEQRQTAKSERKTKPTDYAGILSEEAYQALSKHIKQARNEWDRDTC